MKNKSWLIPVAIILIVFISIIAILITKGYGASTGVYMEAKNGTAMIIRGNSPITMSSNYNGNMFHGLDNGDEIFVIHDGINESYPGSTRAYAVFKLKDGTANDIPQAVVDQLIELGWLDAEDVNNVLNIDG